MVDYSEWTGIATSVAKERYGKPSFEQHGENMKVYARLWNEHKAALKAASYSEAEELAERHL